MAGDLNPQIKNGYSPLSKLTRNALSRYGDFSPASVQGDAAMMFISFANLIVDEVNRHPYREGEDEISYYTSFNDVREIHDSIIESGLLSHYSVQQFSEKAGVYQPMYYNTLNSRLWHEKNGNTSLAMWATDEARPTEDD